MQCTGNIVCIQLSIIFNVTGYWLDWAFHQYSVIVTGLPIGYSVVDINVISLQFVKAYSRLENLKTPSMICQSICKCKESSYQAAMYIMSLGFTPIMLRHLGHTHIWQDYNSSNCFVDQWCSLYCPIQCQYFTTYSVLLSSLILLYMLGKSQWQNNMQ